MNYISLNIKHLRNEKNISQSDLEKELGLKRGVLSSYERSINTPPIQFLIDLSSFFQVSIDDLVNVKLSEYQFKVEEPARRYFTKQDLYNIHELVDTVNDMKIKMVELERLVIKLQKSIKD